MVSGWAAGNQRGIESLIEGGEAASMLHGEGKEVDVGELPGRWEGWEKARIHERDALWPELMAGSGEQAAQQSARGCGGIGTVVGTGTAQNTKRAIYSDWTCRPAVSLCLWKEPRRGSMMDMSGVHQSDQHVDIEQRDHSPLGCIAF